ncbi:RNA polymerase sigma factor [Marinibacterium sp. SX1]|uniref:RNA polymerase sigma factor n=1 Tax=Marinibacterium sp. SX1 TaxID=3388424 RepID=UPI003D183FFC
MIRLDADIVRAARQGDRAALASVVSAVEQPVFGLAIRMLANRADAEDATQEILVKIITHLGTLQDDGAAGGWALKIASRHLVAIRKRGRVEAMRMSFHDFAEDLETGLDQSAVTQMDDVVTAVAIEEIKIGCTLAMLTCLKRNSRIAYILGDIFEMTDSEASEVLQIAPATYRQQLRRARAEVTQFLQKTCGNVSTHATCRCEKRLNAAQANGRVVPGKPAFGLERPPIDLKVLRRRVRALEEGRRAATLMRSNPAFPSNVGAAVLEAIK